MKTNDPPKQKELLPCPFCGYKAVLDSGECVWDKVMDRQLYSAEVACVNQITCAARIGMILDDEEEAKTMCIKQWNTRTSIPAAPKISEHSEKEWTVEERIADNDFGAAWLIKEGNKVVAALPFSTHRVNNKVDQKYKAASICTAHSVPPAQTLAAAPVAQSDGAHVLQKYRKRPVVITAQQFMEGEPIPKGVCFGWRCGISDSSAPHVHTIHENQRVDIVFGDWIIPEPDGEHYYPCKPDIFWRTYESYNPEP